MRRAGARSGWRRRAARLFVVVLRWFLLVPAAGLLAAWLVGRVFTDRYEWSQWLFWMPTPTAIAACFLGLAAAGLRRWTGRGERGRRGRRGRGEMAAWGVTLAAVLAYFVAGEHRFLRGLASPPAPAEEARSFEILQWTTDWPWGPAVETHLKVLRAIDADVAIVSHPGMLLREEGVKAWLGTPYGGQLHAGFGVFTRRAILGGGSLRVDFKGIRLGYVVIDASESLGRPLVMYLIDLPSDPDLPRHEVAREVAGLMAQARRQGAPEPDVVAGDFNATRGGAAIDMMFPGMTEAWNEAGVGYGATYPRHLPLWHIDHVLLAPWLEARASRIVDPGFGRHRLQVVRVGAEE